MKPLHLFATKAGAAAYNRSVLDGLQGKEYQYPPYHLPEVGGLGWVLDTDDNDQGVSLKVGISVVHLTNNYGASDPTDLHGTLRNGTPGIVRSFQQPAHSSPYNALPVIYWRHGFPDAFESVLYPIMCGNPRRVRMPLLVAEALTIRKSIGVTAEAVVLHCADIFEPGQFLLGISRTRSLRVRWS